MLYRANVNHNGLHVGEIVDLHPEQVDDWRGEIEAGFLEPVGGEAPAHSFGPPPE